VCTPEKKRMIKEVENMKKTLMTESMAKKEEVVVKLVNMTGWFVVGTLEKKGMIGGVENKLMRMVDFDNVVEQGRFVDKAALFANQNKHFRWKMIVWPFGFGVVCSFALIVVDMLVGKEGERLGQLVSRRPVLENLKEMIKMYLLAIYLYHV